MADLSATILLALMPPSWTMGGNWLLLKYLIVGVAGSAGLLFCAIVAAASMASLSPSDPDGDEVLPADDDGE